MKSILATLGFRPAPIVVVGHSEFVLSTVSPRRIETLHRCRSANVIKFAREQKEKITNKDCDE